MIRIGHASIGSDGKAKNDAFGQGDNNKKEVCTRLWYNKGWNLVIRPKDSMVAERMALACEAACANDNIGYDQNRRNSLRKEAAACNWNLKKITNKCSTDCSALMAICAEVAGVAMYAQYVSGNAPTTSTMAKKFYATGMFDILTDKSYTTDYKRLRRGDILVKEGSHTVMVLDDGDIWEDKPTLSLDSKGSWVKIMQNRLIVKGYTLKPDGDFGTQTMLSLVAFQGEAGLKKDSICGPKTWTKLFL